MKVLIADDDAASRKLLRYFIGSLPNYKIIGEAANGEELIKYVTKEKPDVALVDIGMPLLNGMEAVKACKELFPSLQVIFITGHDDYALEAFSVRAVDYILKPIERNRLYSALERAAQAGNIKADKEQSVKKNLMIKQQKNILFIPLDDIIFIERIDRKSVIHTKNNNFETNEALASLEGALDSRFIASHRSYIINVGLLTKIEAAGQMYKAYFQDYNNTARVSKHKIDELQRYKSL
ncbi:LytTR family DNA-binding domain-containing protein [Domibacillus sp. A3M-37]|uniref:LytR/AlgR family response regulator transcription factor n=1 Tax=Domibacillus TaxID=1433999 RepID=UPI0006180229|nr:MULTISPECIES: LytTR family DNA-binding domain-containing protein [Domibacillus]MCP3761037.1 LytTR family DNA-binding domain-containing protein [Domibacillus sp. A3M-37]